MRLMLCVLYHPVFFTGVMFFSSAMNFVTYYKSTLKPQAVVIEALKGEGGFLPVFLVG